MWMWCFGDIWGRCIGYQKWLTNMSLSCIPRIGTTSRAANQLTPASYWFIGLICCVTPKIAVNHNAQVNTLLSDAYDKKNARMVCVASLAWLDHIHGQKRGCMTATIGIQTFTSKCLATKVFVGVSHCINTLSSRLSVALPWSSSWASKQCRAGCRT